MAAINFVMAGSFRNIARASPLDAGLRVMGDSERRHVYCTGSPPTPLIAVSAGMVQASSLLAGPSKGMKQKWIKLVFHTQEWQRSMGFVATVSGHTELHAQFAMNALQISTRPEFAKKSTSGSECLFRSLVFISNIFCVRVGIREGRSLSLLQEG